MSLAGDNGYEDPALLKASSFLSKEEMSGPNHKVDENVKNDGFVNHYTIRYADNEIVAIAHDDDFTPCVTLTQ